MAVDRTQLILLENLINRMEFNTNQNNWKLPGAITQNEYEAVRRARQIFSWKADQEDKDRG